MSSRADVKNLDLDESTLYKLVDTYKNYPELWNIKHPWYYRRSKRFDTYIEITKLMNIDGLGAPEIARKMRTIWLTYNSSETVEKAGSENSSQDIEMKDVNNLRWFHVVHEMIKDQKLPKNFSFPVPVHKLSVSDVIENYSGRDDDYEMDFVNASGNKRPNSTDSGDFPVTKRLQWEQISLLVKLFEDFLNPVQLLLALQAENDISDILLKFKFTNLNEIHAKYYI